LRRERLYSIGVVTYAVNVVVDAIGVRPIGLDCNSHEAFLRDKSLGELGAPAVELMSTMGRLAE
jgi:hypothetical protein